MTCCSPSLIALASNMRTENLQMLQGVAATMPSVDHYILDNLWSPRG